MIRHSRTPIARQALCGQAEEISQILLRADSLPVPLHVSIEELLEGAWEIAYRKAAVPSGAIVIEFAQMRSRQG